MNGRVHRALALCGLIGPAAFTAAWALGTVRQPGYSVAHEHISGLAAPDADNPAVMTVGFLALGTATVGFAAALEERLGAKGSGKGPAKASAGLGPALIGVSGVAMVVAGLFRRDRMSNYPNPARLRASRGSTMSTTPRRSSGRSPRRWGCSPWRPGSGANRASRISRAPRWWRPPPGRGCSRGSPVG